MSSAFRDHIHQSLGDVNLQAALDANAERRIYVRKEAFASITDPEEMRARAHEIRRDVIENLERYLEQFTIQLEANGVQVHRAGDATQAVQIIFDIIRQRGVKLIAKSKTMVSEEIELNAALEAAGLRVVETDLGEFIVQIRNETPSHIITPAVHLQRADVGRTFQKVLGIPFTDDIHVMTSVARKTLREVFLKADMGISGVNFGVAESGTLCVVTNEGNGRMVTTLPAVHVALMGIERIVPTLDDLALMLALLPRSATGQKLTVYTNLIHSPRRENDPDGAEERHVILLDNGRSRIKCSPLGEILYCIRCGACLNACPVFREIGGHAYVGVSNKHSAYPGPLGSVLAPALYGQGEFGQLARASSLCGACREACPVDIDLPKLLLRVRAGIVEDGKASSAKDDHAKNSVNKPNTPTGLRLGLQLFSWVATSTTRFSAAQRFAGMFGRLGSGMFHGFGKGKKNWFPLPAFTGWGLSKDFPAPAQRSFHRRWKALKTQGVQTLAQKSEKPADLQLERPDRETRLNKCEVFRKELTELGGFVWMSSKQDVAEVVLSLLTKEHATKVLTWDENHLPGGLLETLQQRGIEMVYPTHDMKDLSSQVRVGLTGTVAGIAETGTLLVTSGEGRSLSASLLPEVHIAILNEDDLYEHLGDVITLPEVRQASTAVLITGPSRTADIEMTLTIGVHGPGVLHVICLQ